MKNFAVFIQNALFTIRGLLILAGTLAFTYAVLVLLYVQSILSFILEVMLFSVGALVLWKRPTDNAAAQFFLLCIVTLGAFMGGYHWSHIATQPVLVLIFMVCAVLLPVVSLHFYLIFPRKKAWLER